MTAQHPEYPVTCPQCGTDVEEDADTRTQACPSRVHIYQITHTRNALLSGDTSVTYAYNRHVNDMRVYDHSLSADAITTLTDRNIE